MNGLRILNTRPKHQANALSQAIRSAGGIPIALPTLAIETLPLNWLTQLPPLSTVQQAIFISSNAVHYFFQGLDIANIPWPTTIEVIAIGQSTADALTQRQCLIHTLPNIADSEHLLQLDTLQKVSHHSILLISGAAGRPLIADTLRNKGAFITTIETYKRTCPQKNPKLTHALWQDDAVDIILIWSQQALDNLFVLFEAEAKTWLQSKPCLVISPRLAEIARQHGMKNVVIAAYDDILTTIASIPHGR